jgi:heterodisulfide reductase subunit C
VEAAVRPNGFLNEVVVATPGGERLTTCIQCGTCGGSCPNGAEMEATPRHLFALVQAGQREPVLSMNTMWKCVSCYLCTARCPQEIPITDVMYTLKRMAVKQGYVKDNEAPALARTFTGYVNRYGRSFEFGLASRFYLTSKPASATLRMGPLGLSMFKRGRMSLRPTKIIRIRQLQAIIRKAKALGGAS